MSSIQDHEELVVLTKTHDLILWSCHHTGRFPRNHRLVLGERIERNLYDLLETLITARYIRQRQPLLEQANLTLEVLRFQMRLAKDLHCLQTNSYGSAAKAIDEIGRRLRITHQAVVSMLRTIKQSRERVRSVACAGCGEPIISAECLPSDRGIALCLGCLAERPETPFGRRLLAFRLAAGWTRAELAARTGIDPTTIHKSEVRGFTPRWHRVVRLIQVLGVQLVALGFEGYAGEGLRDGWGTERPAQPKAHRPRKPR